MLLCHQKISLADRSFSPAKGKLLERPTWLSPSIDPPIIDFVRSFGIIRKRKLGAFVDG